MAPRVTATPLRDVLSFIADEARRDGRPLPVIETDRATAHLLADMLATELSTRDVNLRPYYPELAFGVVAMYDGVEIKGSG